MTIYIMIRFLQQGGSVRILFSALHVFIVKKSISGFFPPNTDHFVAFPHLKHLKNL